VSNLTKKIAAACLLLSFYASAADILSYQQKSFMYVRVLLYGLNINL